ncbi:MAG: outer membrane beta-barrel domain-containing protein [Myxococcales bacterium]|nr:outer membrane beta-barrel domain-containing protein [Myxococcales bacterium]
MARVPSWCAPTAAPPPRDRRPPSRWAPWLLGLALSATVASALPSAVEAQCIDEAIRDELNARRRYRGVQERLFQKALRHEISVMGGIYANDLLSSWAAVSGAYTFHFSEALGLELSYTWSRAKSELVRIIENDRGVALLRLNNPIHVYMGNLLWSLAYGKVRWLGGSISRFDFYLSVGAGVTDNQTARGLTFSGGFGMKFYFGQWFAIRLDVRDQILQQEILGESRIVNNIVGTFGLSMFIPFRP